MAGQRVGTSQNNPGPDRELEYDRRTYTYHYHANRYVEGELTSITLTIFSGSGRRQHVTAEEDRFGEWRYQHSGDRIVSDGFARDKLAYKLEDLRQAQSQVREITSTDALDMPLDALVANSQGRW